MADRYSYGWALARAKAERPDLAWMLATSDYGYTNSLGCETTRQAVYLSSVPDNMGGKLFNLNDLAADDRERWWSEAMERLTAQQNDSAPASGAQ